MSEEKEIVLDEKTVQELKAMNSKLALGYAQLGRLEEQALKINEQKAMFFEEIKKINEEIEKISGFIARQNDLTEGKWKVDWETGKVVRV
jgi:hypothetical protein